MTSSQTLLNDRVLSALVAHAPWREGHGASDEHLGLGLCYYGLVYTLRLKRCVCIGSGGGFVPRLMVQAQLDLGEGATYLVDANLPVAGWGQPLWMDDPYLLDHWPQIHVLLEPSLAAAERFSRVDYVHIDADHSYEACRADFEVWSPKADWVSLHDSCNPNAGVARVVSEIPTNQWDVLTRRTSRKPRRFNGSG